jgi:Protein of unknown function (DUF2783)
MIPAGFPTARRDRPMRLNTEPNLASPDDFYEALIELHRGLTDAESAAVNAKLVLLLANHVGDAEALREAMTLARTPARP